MEKLNQLFQKALVNYRNSLVILCSVTVLSLLSCSSNEVVDLESELNYNLDFQGKMISVPSEPEMLVSLPSGAMGSAIGPGGDLFVTQSGAGGSILRINKRTGNVSTFASGLPTSPVPIGGVIDVAFIGETAYALVTLVAPVDFFGTNYVNGIYRIDGPNSYTVIADIGQFAFDNQPSGFDFFIPTGLQYAIQNYQGGFLVTDGHHNRMYHVTLDGVVSEFKTFGNIVPTGMAVKGNSIYMSEAGTSAQSNEDSRVVSFDSNSETVTELGSGAPLLVDVEFNRGRSLFALSQGTWAGEVDGDTAIPDTGSLVMVNDDGTFTVIADGLDRPTSLEFIQNTAYIVTLTGQVWTVNNVAGPSYGL